MKVFVLGLDGATWDVLEPLLQDGLLPNLARLREQGAWGSLRSVFPPLSPVAWTGVMTGKNSGSTAPSSSWSMGMIRWGGESTRRGRSRRSSCGRSPSSTVRRRWPAVCR
jgi:hypothetical protein